MDFWALDGDLLGSITQLASNFSISFWMKFCFLDCSILTLWQLAYKPMISFRKDSAYLHSPMSVHNLLLILLGRRRTQEGYSYIEVWPSDVAFENLSQKLCQKNYFTWLLMKCFRMAFHLLLYITTEHLPCILTWLVDWVKLIFH